MATDLFGHEPSKERKANVEQLLSRMEAPDVIAEKCQMTTAAVYVLIKARNYTPFNNWWATMASGRRAVLINDKWAFAEAAFNAGKREAYVELGHEPL